jgi:transposase-like protein/DNA-directed RNA polymerase subunit N (RpoN/RPB10)
MLQWREVIREFLRDRTGARVSEAIGIERHCIQRMLHHLRTLMTTDIPAPFEGTIEVDETFIGGQWRNKPWRIRRLGTKRGHGTSKQAIFGMLSRSTGQVITTPIPNLKSITLLAVLRAHAVPSALIYTDGWTGYAHVLDFFSHEQVDHQSGMYVRGIVHTNSIESFWGFLKRRLKITGGVRKERLALFLGEETWRFNHRRLSLDEKTEKIYQLLVAT